MTKEYKIKLDKNKCIGCSGCVGLAPKVFEMVDNKSSLKVNKTSDKKVLNAKGCCPVGAIEVTEI